MRWTALRTGSHFGVWEDGRLLRSLSLSTDGGIGENIGEPLPFENALLGR
ncbi:DUF6928 family protein [Spirillospora sp. CA-294931]